MKQRSRTDELLAEFADCVMAQEAAMRRGDPETGNEFARRYIKASKLLLSLGEEGVNAFSVLLRDPRVAVRTMAAGDLLPFRTEESVKVLEQSAGGKGVTGFGAMMTLARWRGREKGMWEEIERISEHANLPKARKRFGNEPRGDEDEQSGVR